MVSSSFAMEKKMLTEFLRISESRLHQLEGIRKKDKGLSNKRMQNYTKNPTSPLGSYQIMPSNGRGK